MNEEWIALIFKISLDHKNFKMSVIYSQGIKNIVKSKQCNQGRKLVRLSLTPALTSMAPKHGVATEEADSLFPDRSK